VADFYNLNSLSASLVKTAFLEFVLLLSKQGKNSPKSQTAAEPVGRQF